MGEERTLTVGQFLRQEREKRNISLEAISKSTRITLKNLESLEKDDFQAFSAPIFLKSFLRAYAQAIGLDPHQVIAMYEEKTEVPEESLPSKKDIAAGKPGNALKYIVPIIIIIIAVIIIILAVSRKPAAPPPPRPAETSAPAKEQPAPPVQEQPAPPTKTTPAPEGKPSSPPPPPETAGEKKALRHVLKIKALEKVWLRIQIDDRPAIDALLKPEETGTWRAGNRIEVLLGNAGGSEVSFDGVPQGPLGVSGEVVRLVLPKE